MSAELTIREGCDIRVLAESGRGTWFGKAARDLSLSSEVDPAVLHNLYQHGIGPDGERLIVVKPVHEWEEAAVAAFLVTHPFASATELAMVRTAERAVKRVPYYDLTITAAESVSVLHASLKVAAKRARDDGDEETADALDAEADGIEADLVESARLVLDELEQEACYTQTVQHSPTAGEWHDGKGLIAAMFTHHMSRDGYPQLHVHVAIANLVQRADKADGKWRSLYGKQLYAIESSVAVTADRAMESRLISRGYPMVKRPGALGAEVDGVSQEVMDAIFHRSDPHADQQDQVEKPAPMPWDVPEYSAEGRAAVERLRRDGLL